MLGKDAAQNEYWHFKSEPGRIYIRQEEKFEVPINPPNLDAVMSESNNV